MVIHRLRVPVGESNGGMQRQLSVDMTGNGAAQMLIAGTRAPGLNRT